MRIDEFVSLFYYKVNINQDNYHMTQSLQIFDSKVRNLKQHTQLLDLALTISRESCTQKRKGGKSKGTIGKDLGAKQNSHLHLNHPNDAKNVNRIFAYSRSKMNEQVIVDLYRIFSDYIVNVMREIFSKNPSHLLSLVSSKEDKVMNFKEILDAGNFQSLKDQMSLKIYRTLERLQSTPKLLDKIIKVTNINVPKDKLDDALMYLEIRHLIIHNNSKADNKFKQMNKAGLVRINSANNRIIIDYPLANAAITSVFVLCKIIDDELIAKGLV